MTPVTSLVQRKGFIVNSRVKARRTSNRIALSLFLAVVIGFFLVRGVTTPWYSVSPSTSSGETLIINNVQINTTVNFTALQMATAHVELTSPEQGTLTPFDLASPNGTSGVSSGIPLTLILAALSLLMAVVAITRKSLLAGLLGCMAAAMSLMELGSFTQWTHSPHFMYSTVTALPGIGLYQLALWGVLALSFGTFAEVGVARAVVLGEKYNRAMNANDHVTLAHSAIDKFAKLAFAGSTSRDSNQSN